ncbi:unnamed protein product [Clonostachys solani]|uniref:Uncharacterized protein n=1 Tax=Clonostachys solani TaxID=160281 RepID=A0A9N9ZG72_9HYPO|nr:unnamed protein product [Clonostachys solani]
MPTHPTDERDPNPHKMDTKTTPDPTEAGLQESSSSVLESFRLLRTIVTRHEATIQRRWIRKKNRQRVEILQRAYPTMPKRHRPEIPAMELAQRKLAAAAMNPSRGVRASGFSALLQHQPVWDAVMLPSLNEEDLAQPRNLLLLLNARARNHPCKFACLDAGNFDTGRNKADGEQSGRLVLLLDEEKYGTVVDSIAVPPPLNELRNDIHFGPVEASHVLKMQDRMMKFLVACCREILHDVPGERLINDQLPVPEEPNLDLQPDKNRFASPCHMVQESPYLVPSDIDTDRIESILGACVASAEDHIWALRQDPGYFKMWWREEMDHDPQSLQGLREAKRKVNSAPGTLKTANKCLPNATQLAEMMVAAYMQFEVFALLHDCAKEVRMLRKKYAPSISALKDLPQPLFEALIKFHKHLRAMAYAFVSRIWDAMPASPPLRRFFTASTNDSGSHHVELKMSVDKTTAEYKLVRTLSNLRDGCLQVVGLPTLSARLDEVALLLHNDPRAHGLLSPLMHRYMGDLSVVFQCVNQLQMYYPWSRIFDAEMAKMKPRPVEAMMSNALRAALIEELVTQQPHFCDPTHQQFEYPSTKRRSEETVNAMIRAEKTVDTIWQCFDRLADNYIPLSDASPFRRLEQMPSTIHRTPEWTSTELSAPVSEAPSPCIPETASAPEPTRNVYLDHDNDATKNSGYRLEKKVKIKTRGQAAEPTDKAPSPPDTEADEDALTPVQIPVSQRAMKVFRKLFFDPEFGTGSGELAWKDFVYAMTGPGLFSAEQLYGSAWGFSRDGDPGSSVGRSRMLFHQPHPSNKMSIEIARSIGGRLQRHFGWDINTFVLSK